MVAAKSHNVIGRVEQIASVIGTAGHVDHGKTSLVRALTGMDTDTLAEEKKREISIDLGFAHLDFELPDRVLRVAIVDVPGHERFIKNMLVGATGFSAVLFTVAADDGIMPQTTEHFRIVRLLGLKSAVFAITKTDVVSAARIEKVRAQINALVEGTVFQGAAVIPVSSVTNEGIEELKSVLKALVLKSVRRNAPGLFRLPIDRVFSVKGFGTVVTGTIASGSVAKGDSALCFPSMKAVKVRGIENMHLATDVAVEGSRAALNISGVSFDELKRGDLLFDPRLASAFVKLKRANQHIDAAIEFVTDPGPYLAGGKRRLSLHCMSSNTVAAFRFAPDVNARGERFCRMVLAEPIAASTGDRFILRDTSLNATVAGGRVIVSYMTRREVPAFKKALAFLDLSADELPCAYLKLMPLVDREDVSALMNLPVEDVFKSTNCPEDSGIVRIGNFAALGAVLEELEGGILSAIKEANEKNATIDVPAILAGVRERIDRPLFPEELAPVLDAMVEAEKITKDVDGYRISGVSIAKGLDPMQEKILKSLPDGYSALYANDILRLGIKKSDFEGRMALLLKAGFVVRLSENAFMSSKSVEDARRLLDEFFKTHDQMKATDFRDLLGCGRKLAIELLEYFDRERITLRKGDLRILR